MYNKIKVYAKCHLNRTTENELNKVCKNQPLRRGKKGHKVIK